MLLMRGVRKIMAPGVTRRTVLATTAAAMGATAVTPPIQAQEDDSCDEIDALESEIAELEAELADLEDLLDDLPSEKASVYGDIVDLHGERTDPVYPSDIRSEAKTVGMDVRDSVVILDVVEEFGVGMATAWVADDGLLLTNSHNVNDGFTELSCVSLEGESYDASVLDYVENESPDVALLETDFDGEPLPTGSSDTLSQGDHMVQIGHPGDFAHWVITLGEFDEKENNNTLLSTVPGVQGTSGSPIVNLDGEVVAMTYGGRSEGSISEDPADPDPVYRFFTDDDITTAVPIETAIQKMEEWR